MPVSPTAHYLNLAELKVKYSRGVVVGFRGLEQCFLKVPKILILGNVSPTGIIATQYHSSQVRSFIVTYVDVLSGQ